MSSLISRCRFSPQTYTSQSGRPTWEQGLSVVIVNEVKQSRIVVLRLPHTLRVLAMAKKPGAYKRLSLFLRSKSVGGVSLEGEGWLFVQNQVGDQLSRQWAEQDAAAVVPRGDDQIRNIRKAANSR